MGDYLPFPKSILFPLVAKKKGLAADGQTGRRCLQLEKVAGPVLTAGASRRSLTFDDMAMYQYTGGTTGVSKGVMLTHRNLS